MTALVALDRAVVGYAGRPVLANVTLTIMPGERIALLGRSGVGKSTLLNTLYDRLAAQAALIPQAASLVPQLSCFHNVYMGRLDRHSSLRNLRELVWPAGATLSRGRSPVWWRASALPTPCWQKAGSLSGGQAQRTSVARALYNGRPDRALATSRSRRSIARQGARVLETHPRDPSRRAYWRCTTSALALENATRIVALKRRGASYSTHPAPISRESDLAPVLRGASRGVAVTLPRRHHSATARSPSSFSGLAIVAAIVRRPACHRA